MKTPKHMYCVTGISAALLLARHQRGVEACAKAAEPEISCQIYPQLHPNAKAVFNRPRGATNSRAFELGCEKSHASTDSRGSSLLHCGIRTLNSLQ
jgi:hypothetical protein